MEQTSISRRIALVIGPAIFTSTLFLLPPAQMSVSAFHVAGVAVWMAIWWVTQAVPLTVTAFLPFLFFPLAGVMSAKAVASQYYSPILFLILGGAFLALAIEKAELHRRLALAITRISGGGAHGILVAFMAATALLSMIISNTSSTLIMVPIALSILQAAQIKEVDKNAFAQALILGIAFAATIGGLGTLVGSPTNAIAAGLINKALGTQIDFFQWLSFGLPIVILGVPLCAIILILHGRIRSYDFDANIVREVIQITPKWSSAQRRLIPIILFVFTGWVSLPFLKGFLPPGALTDGSVAMMGALLLFIFRDKEGEPLLDWRRANAVPWGVIMMFGGGLALAAGVIESGLATWLGGALSALRGVPIIIVAALVVALIILITEFASNVATASAIMPVIAGLILATGADPYLLAMPAALAASWGFMLPSGTGPNAIAWASGYIRLSSMLLVGLILDFMGILLIIGVVWVAVNW